MTRLLLKREEKIKQKGKQKIKRKKEEQNIVDVSFHASLTNSDRYTSVCDLWNVPQEEHRDFIN